MELYIRIAGALLIFLAVVHLLFPARFKWKDELQGLSLINRQLMYVHTFFIGLILVLMGLLCLASARDIVETNLGRQVALGVAVFWLVRLYFQLFVYSPLLWKGMRFETTIHITFTLIWIYFTAIFFMVAFNL